MLIEWTDDLSVGSETIDEEHKTLIGVVNQLHEAIEKGSDRRTIGDLLGRLAEFVAIHFAEEEQIMRRVRYPGIDQHIQHHGALLDQLGELFHQFEVGNIDVTPRTTEFLSDWVLIHLKSQDRELGNYLNQRHALLAS